MVKYNIRNNKTKIFEMAEPVNRSPVVVITENATSTGSQPAHTDPGPVIMFKWGSKQKPFRCQLCDMSFENGEKLRDHMTKHTDRYPEKPYPCKVCPKSFQTYKSLERHALIHYGQALKRCKFCYKVFANKENLEKHIVIHDGKKPYKCGDCGEQFVFKQGLETHMVIHTGVRPYVCQICYKGFNRKDILERHMIVHSGDKKYKCVECDKSFAHSFVLKRHTRTVHSQEFSGRECEICGKFIKSKENIRRHMKLHSGERPFKCSICEKTFTQKQHAIDHMVIHTNLCPFKCNYCGKEFKYKRSLNRHVAWHEGKLLFTCDIKDCHRRFQSKTSLTKHKLVHGFPCTVCKAKYKTFAALQRHYDIGHNDVTFYREIGVGTDDTDEPFPEGIEIVDSAKTKQLIADMVNRKNKEAKVIEVAKRTKIKAEKVDKTESGKEDIIFIVLENDGQKQIMLDNVTSGNDDIIDSLAAGASQIGDFKVSKMRMSDGNMSKSQETLMAEERSQLIQTLIDFAEQQNAGKTSTKADEETSTEEHHYSLASADIHNLHSYAQAYKSQESEANSETDCLSAIRIESVEHVYDEAAESEDIEHNTEGTTVVLVEQDMAVDNEIDTHDNIVENA